MANASNRSIIVGSLAFDKGPLKAAKSVVRNMVALFEEAGRRF